MGADVIKVEPVRGDDAAAGGRRSSTARRPGSSRSTATSAASASTSASAAGREVLFRLLESADVFVENLNPSKLEKHGLGLQGLRSGSRTW